MPGGSPYERVSKAVVGLKAAGVTVVMVGHRPAMMASLDKLAVINEGQLEAFGPAAAVLARLRAVAPQPTVAPLPSSRSQRVEAQA